MIAEYTIGLVILVFCLGYVLGEHHGRTIQRNLERLRVSRLFNNIGGIRYWE